MDTSQFQQFFDHCVGDWVTERTYHYLGKQEVERSRTTFSVNRLTSVLKLKVLGDNQYPKPAEVESLPGFSLAFHTVSEKGEEVSQQLNLLFVPHNHEGDNIEGAYLRDKAYEESRPIVSHFRFHNRTRELLMTTYYTRVVSLDSITLINPSLRIRRIYNYQRPPGALPLETMLLVGFGVEQKS